MSHYFDQEPSSQSDPFLIEVVYQQHTYHFHSDHGVFSKEHFDFASRLLTDSIQLEAHQSVCDLGCGIGIIGLLLEMHHDIALTMIDINDRAIACAKKNTETFDSKAKVISHDGLRGLDMTFDVIVSNPPVRIGKERLYHFIEESLNHLNPGGVFYFVMHKKHGVHSLIKYFKDRYQVDIITQSKGFKVGIIREFY